MRLYRPYIPLEVRCRVALRQAGYDDNSAKVGLAVNSGRLGAFLGGLLTQVVSRIGCSVRELHLDHDPPLAARMRRTMLDGTMAYSPDANSPDHLIYREKHAHQIKTNVRGEHGQFPDRVLIKRERKRLKLKQGKVRPKPRSRIRSRGFDKTKSRKFSGKVVRRGT